MNYFFFSGQGQVSGCYELGNEMSDYIKYEEFSAELMKY